MEITEDLIYSTNLLLPTWAREYAGEDVPPCRRHQSQIMHPAIFPELGVISSSLPVDDSCNLGGVDENVVRKEVAVSEVDLCIRREAAEQLLDVLGPAEFKEHTTVVVEVLLGALKRVRRVPREGHEPVVVGTPVTDPMALLGYERISLRTTRSRSAMWSSSVEGRWSMTVSRGTPGHSSMKKYQTPPIRFQGSEATLVNGA